MARYIDADILKVTIDRKMAFADVYEKSYIKEMIVDEMPTADVAPVVHGKWSDEIGDTHSTGKFRVCSACGGNVFIPYFSRHGILRIDFDYCPNCSAIMDLED